MEIKPLTIDGCFELQTKWFTDDRGMFNRLFCADSFSNAKIEFSIKQSNFSLTKYKGTVRGFHYQDPPFSESKIVKIVKGRILDVCLDLRKNSKTFLKHVAVELNAENGNALLLPKGCAHGFQAQTDDVQIVYFHDELYNPKADRVVNAQDPKLGINWPLPLLMMSDKDKNAPSAFTNFGGLVL